MSRLNSNIVLTKYTFHLSHPFALDQSKRFQGLLPKGLLHIELPAYKKKIFVVYGYRNAKLACRAFVNSMRVSQASFHFYATKGTRAERYLYIGGRLMSVNRLAEIISELDKRDPALVANVS